MPKGVPMTEKKFLEIKRLLSYDMTKVQIAEITKVSSGIVGDVAKANTFPEYKKNRDERKTCNAPKKINVAESYNNRTYEQLKANGEKLSLIVSYLRDCAKSLAEIKEAWK